jgi:hypothetical protein
MARSVASAFAQLRDAVIWTLVELAARKEVLVSPAEVDEVVSHLREALLAAEARLPASLPPHLATWLCDVCEIKADLITSLVSSTNVGGQRAAVASFRANAELVGRDIETVAFVADCVAAGD